MTHVKICGVTSVSDAFMCVREGADSIGINFYAGSPRCCPVDVAREIALAVGDSAISVAVFVDESVERVRALKAEVGFRCVQLHGDETPEMLLEFLPHAYKAFRVRGPEIVVEVQRFAGEHVLLDAYHPDSKGGTGAVFDWELARSVTATRKVTLAGGLHPGNVAEAVRAVAPFCVDVASGVESAPGKKDPAKVRAFIQAAKGASPSRAAMQR